LLRIRPAPEVAPPAPGVRDVVPAAGPQRIPLGHEGGERLSDGQAEQVDELVGGGADLAGDLEAGDTVGFVE
jgi:hypothetical protein